MIDIHSHIEKENGVYLLEKLLADMDRFQIQKRVISDLRVDGIRKKTSSKSIFWYWCQSTSSSMGNLCKKISRYSIYLSSYGVL